MIIEFQENEGDLSLENTYILYNGLIKGHLKNLESLDKCNFFFLRSLMIYILILLFFLIYQKFPFVTSCYNGIALLGISVMFLLLKKLRSNFAYEIKNIKYIKKGLVIENNIDYSMHFFNDFFKTKSSFFQGNLILKAFVFGLIFLMTIGSSFYLTSLLNVWVTLTTFLFSVFPLLFFIFYIHKGKVLYDELQQKNGCGAQY